MRDLVHGKFRILHNEELCNLCKSCSIFGVVEIKELGSTWWGKLARSEYDGNKLYVKIGGRQDWLMTMFSDGLWY
jgi:hypothetical protein